MIGVVVLSSLIVYATSYLSGHILLRLSMFFSLTTLRRIQRNQFIILSFFSSWLLICTEKCHFWFMLYVWKSLISRWLKSCLCCSMILIIELDFPWLSGLVSFSKRGMVMLSSSKMCGKWLQIQITDFLILLEVYIPF